MLSGNSKTETTFVIDIHALFIPTDNIQEVKRHSEELGFTVEYYEVACGKNDKGKTITKTYWLLPGTREFLNWINQYDMHVCYFGHDDDNRNTVLLQNILDDDEINLLSSHVLETRVYDSKQDITFNNLYGINFQDRRLNFARIRAEIQTRFSEFSQSVLVMTPQHALINSRVDLDNVILLPRVSNMTFQHLKHNNAPEAAHEALLALNRIAFITNAVSENQKTYQALFTQQFTALPERPGCYKKHFYKNASHSFLQKGLNLLQKINPHLTLIEPAQQSHFELLLTEIDAYLEKAINCGTTIEAYHNLCKLMLSEHQTAVEKQKFLNISLALAKHFSKGTSLQNFVMQALSSFLSTYKVFQNNIAYREGCKKILEVYNELTLQMNETLSPAERNTVAKVVSLLADLYISGKKAAPPLSLFNNTVSHYATQAKPFTKVTIEETDEWEISPEQMKQLGLNDSAYQSVGEISENLHKVINAYGFEYHAVPGDGSCLYHAVFDQLKEYRLAQKLKIQSAEHLRLIARDFINLNRHIYVNYFGDEVELDDFLEKIGKPYVQAQQFEISALALALKITIAILSSVQNMPPIIFRAEDNTTHCFLGYDQKGEYSSHYSSLVCVAPQSSQYQHLHQQIAEAEPCSGFVAENSESERDDLIAATAKALANNNNNRYVPDYKFFNTVTTHLEKESDEAGLMFPVNPQG